MGDFNVHYFFRDRKMTKDSKLVDMANPDAEIQARYFASMLGLSVERLSQLIKSDVIHKNARGRYTINCVTEYVAWIRAKAMSRNSQSLVGDANDERARLLKAQADHKEIEVDSLKGNVIDAEIVQEAWSMIVANSKAKLLGIPSKTAHRLIACDNYAQAEELLTEQIEIALSELANGKVTNQTRYQQDDESVESTA